jgi:glutaminase
MYVSWVHFKENARRIHHHTKQPVLAVRQDAASQVQHHEPITSCLSIFCGSRARRPTTKEAFAEPGGESFIHQQVTNALSDYPLHTHPRLAMQFSRLAVSAFLLAAASTTTTTVSGFAGTHPRRSSAGMVTGGSIRYIGAFALHVSLPMFARTLTLLLLL